MLLLLNSLHVWLEIDCMMCCYAQDGERCQGNRRTDLKILGDMGKLGVKPTGIALGAGNSIIVRLTANAFIINKK